MLFGEGAYPVVLISPPGGSRDDYGEYTATAGTEFARKAMRLEQQTAGNEQILGEAHIEVGGMLTWVVRKDDELEGFDVDRSNPNAPVLVKTRPRLNSNWKLRDVASGETYEIVSVTEYRVRLGEVRYKLHTKSSPSA